MSIFNSLNGTFLSIFDKAILYDECLRMKRDARLKAVFFPTSPDCASHGSWQAQPNLSIIVITTNLFLILTIQLQYHYVFQTQTLGNLGLVINKIGNKAAFILVVKIVMTKPEVLLAWSVIQLTAGLIVLNRDCQQIAHEYLKQLHMLPGFL